MIHPVVFLAMVACLSDSFLNIAASPIQSLSINSPVSGGYLNPLAAYANAGYANAGYGYGNYGYVSPYFAPTIGSSQNSVSGVSHEGSAFNAYSSVGPYSIHKGSNSYNPYFGEHSYDKFSSVPGAATKVSHKKSPFGFHYGAQQTVGIPGLPGSYTVTTKTTATRNPVIPHYGHFANVGVYGGYGGFGGYGAGYAQYPAGALAYGVSPYGPPQQISFQRGYPKYRSKSRKTLRRLTGYDKK